MGEVNGWDLSASHRSPCVFCNQCGTICISNMREEDVIKLNNNMPVKVISYEEAWKPTYDASGRKRLEGVKEFLKCGDDDYTIELMSYTKRYSYPNTGLLEHKFYHLDNGSICDEFILCEQFHDSVINRVAWYDEKNGRPAYCPICGNEIITQSKSTEERHEISANIEKYLGRSLTSQERKDLMKYFYKGSINLADDPISANKKYEDKFDPFECRQETDTYLKDCNNYTSIAPIKMSNKNKVNIAEYIDHLINMEIGIRYNSELLYNLLLNQRKPGRLARYERYGLPKKIELNLKRNALEQSQLAERFKLDDTKPNIDAFNLEKPQKKNIKKPFIYPPTYKKPGLFNKSKVLAENERLKQDYLMQVDKANEEYEKAVKESEEKYESELAEYNKKIAQMEEEYYSRQKEKNEKIEAQKAAEEHRLLEEQKHLEDEKKKFAEDIDNQLLNSSNQQINNMLLQEIAEAKETIQKLYDTKRQLLYF